MNDLDMCLNDIVEAYRYRGGPAEFTRLFCQNTLGKYLFNPQILEVLPHMFYISDKNTYDIYTHVLFLALYLGALDEDDITYHLQLDEILDQSTFSRIQSTLHFFLSDTNIKIDDLFENDIPNGYFQFIKNFTTIHWKCYERDYTNLLIALRTENKSLDNNMFFNSKKNTNLLKKMAFQPNKCPEIYHPDENSEFINDDISKLIKKVFEPWCPKNHFVWPYLFRKNVKYLLFINVNVIQIPQKLWFNIIGYLGRYAIDNLRYTIEDDKERCNSCGKPSNIKCVICDKHNITKVRCGFYCSQKCQKFNEKQHSFQHGFLGIKYKK